jgi:hypothetical protein
LVIFLFITNESDSKKSVLLKLLLLSIELVEGTEPELELNFMDVSPSFNLDKYGSIKMVMFLLEISHPAAPKYLNVKFSLLL